MSQLTMTPPVAGNIRLQNGRKNLKKNAAMISGAGAGGVNRTSTTTSDGLTGKTVRGVTFPRGPISVPKEKDERKNRKLIEASRRPTNYGKAKPKYKPDVSQPRSVINKRSVKYGRSRS